MGPHAFSEVEVRNIRDYLQALKPTPILALAIHAESQKMLTPYGYKVNEYPPNVEEIVIVKNTVAYFFTGSESKL